MLDMEVEAKKSECIDTWNYSFSKEYRRELDGRFTLFLEDDEAGFEYGYAETTGKKIVKMVNNLVLQETVCSFGIAGS